MYCTHLCSGSASDTYIRRELAPHKRYNVCTRLGFSCWFGLIPVSSKQAYIARNYAIQLYSYHSRCSAVSIHISVLICSYFYLFVSDRSVREICIYEKRGKVVLEIARTKHVRKHEQFSVCDRCIHVFINVLEIARTNHVRKHRSIPGIFNLL